MPLQSRFQLTKRKRFLNAVRKVCFRTSSTDIHITRVDFVSDPALVTVESDEVTTSRGKTMSIHGYFPHTMWHRIPKSLQVLNGKLTLYLQQFTPRGPLGGWPGRLDCSVYHAIWCQQGVRTKVRPVRGVIAVARDDAGPRFAFHQEGEWIGDTRGEALMGVRRMERAGVVIEKAQRRQRDFSFVEEIYGNRIVIERDKLERLRMWCRSVGFNIDVGKITLGDVIRGYWVQPNERVRGLIRSALAESAKEVPGDRHKISLN